MKIIEFFSSENQEHWLEEIAKSDWGAGQWLGDLLKEGKLRENTGAGTLVPMLTDGDKLISFCTFAPLDEIQPTDLTPWIGFVYTFPEYRGHRYAGEILDWCESMATVMGKKSIYISTNHVGLYESYGYEFLDIMKDIQGEDCRVYTKSLQANGPEKDGRCERGEKWKAEVVSAAKKDLDMTSYCGFSCSHCFLGEWCGGCRSFFNCCSYGTMCDKGVCTNISCCREKGYDGCYECGDIVNCTKGFYSIGKDGIAAKAQALFVRKYGKEEFFKVHDNLHAKYDFQKTQEVLGYDLDGALKIMEENR